MNALGSGMAPPDMVGISLYFGGFNLISIFPRPPPPFLSPGETEVLQNLRAQLKAENAQMVQKTLSWPSGADTAKVMPGQQIGGCIVPKAT